MEDTATRTGRCRTTAGRLAAAWLLVWLPALLSGIAGGVASAGGNVAAESLPRAFAHRALHARARAWRSAADTHAPSALAQLILAYDRTGENPHGQAQLASIACDAFGAPEHLETLGAWRRAHDSARDSWLWFRTLACEVRCGRPELAQACAVADVAPWKRAVALEALAGLPTRAEAALFSDEAARLPEAPVERTLVLEALANLWVSFAQREGAEASRAAGLWLVDQLERKETPRRAQRTILRCLQRAFHLPAPFEEPGYWRDQLLAREKPAGESRSYALPPGPSFLDLAGSGRRVVYVLDCSGSMVEPLTRQEREDLARHVGKPASTRPERKAGPAGNARTTAARTWASVERRIDAAKQLMRCSLATLPKGASFAVVLFASKHAYLHATPGLVEATPERVAEALKDLDQVVAGSGCPLGGGTNLHGGLTRALQTRVVGATHGSDPFDGLLDAPDTLFVLSDGSPGQDDWSEEDPQRRPSTTFDPHADAGTFYDPDQLLDDAARLNLLRRCEIHCVGLGVAQADVQGTGPVTTPGTQPSMPLATLLERLATLGHGRYRPVPLQPSTPVPAATVDSHPGR